MKPVVFLDIDGVLCIKGCRPGTFAPECVTALNWLTDATAAQIVVSSTWRHGTGWRERIEGKGITAKIIGRTPDLNDRNPGTVIWTSVTRGTEIKTWLHRHAPRPFVILDDDTDMDDLRDYLVQTSFDSGLTRPLAELAARVVMRSERLTCAHRGSPAARDLRRP